VSQFLESIVRPAQSDVTLPQPYYTPGQIGVPNVILRLGRNGGGSKTLNGSVSISVSSYCERHENEKGTEE
jgi:hypothetical protein